MAVDEVASDAEIWRRLTSILQATDWFDEIDDESNQGVVILPFFGNATRKRGKIGLALAFSRLAA